MKQARAHGGLSSWCRAMTLLFSGSVGLCLSSSRAMAMQFEGFVKGPWMPNAMGPWRPPARAIRRSKSDGPGQALHSLGNFPFVERGVAKHHGAGIAQRGFLAHDQRISGLEAIDAHAVAAYAPFQFESRWQPIGKMPDQMHARLGARDVGSLEMMLQRVDQAVAAKRVNGANAA